MFEVEKFPSPSPLEHVTGHVGQVGVVLILQKDLLSGVMWSLILKAQFLNCP